MGLSTACVCHCDLRPVKGAWPAFAASVFMRLHHEGMEVMQQAGVGAERFVDCAAQVAKAFDYTGRAVIDLTH